MADIVETAWAKINLALHVVGRRADGFHRIESIVTFAETGDRLYFDAARTDRFTLSGPFADGLSCGADNLVARARDALRAAATDGAPPVAIHLEKNLPIAAGVGGGSADAAACLRGLMRLWNRPAGDDTVAELAARLGADVPMCLISRPLFAEGIGERTRRIDTMPAMAIVLVNPGVAVSTPQVFATLRNKHNPPVASDHRGGVNDWVRAIKALRNDLQAPAETLAPSIAAAGDALADTDALLVRMSGSGATCFGLYGSSQEARRAADAIRAAHPAWYVCATTTRPGGMSAEQ